MKRSYITSILIMSGVAATLAATRMIMFPEEVQRADAIVIATCLAPQKDGGLVAYTRVRDVWKDMEWEYGKLDEDASDEQLQSYLGELRLLSHKMSAVSNRYAVAALLAEGGRHQREFTVPFKIDLVLKGTVNTNDIALTYTRAITQEEFDHPFKTNTQYILFLAHRYRDVRGYHFFPSSGTWSPWGSLRPVSTNYVVQDEWETTEIGTPSKPLAIHTKQHSDQRNFTHEQFIVRIKELVKKQEMTTIEFTVPK